MISKLIDPGYQPPSILPAFQPVRAVESDPARPLDQKIVNFLCDQPEAVAESLHPANRSEKRELTIRKAPRVTLTIH
jgi:hypothetical protein